MLNDKIYDDVAFFYLSITVIATILFPWTLSKLYNYYYNKPKSNNNNTHSNIIGNCNCSLCIDKVKLLESQTNKNKFKQYITFSNILFVGLWLLFLYMLILIPSFKYVQLVSFKPYEILELDSSERYTDKQIAKHKNKLLLKWHPDRNKGNEEEAHQKSILINKAYEALTDAVAKENIERYGNPDGRSEWSATIGLPSIFSKKENENKILIVYFLIFIVIPPIIVFLWWRNARNYIDNGVLRGSIENYYYLMQPNMGPKFLIEVLCLSKEFENILQTNNSSVWTQQKQNDYKDLFNSVKDSMVKQKFYDPTRSRFRGKLDYVHRASVLLHAYLLRVDIPQSLQLDLNNLLVQVPKLINSMLELAMGKRFMRCLFGLVDLNQLIIQRMWPHQPLLLQLPHIDANIAKKLNKKNIFTIAQLRKALNDEKNTNKLHTLIPELSNNQWNDINRVAELIPIIDMDYNYGIEEEDNNIYEGDIITVTVTLQRIIAFDPDKNYEHNNIRLQTADEDEELDSTGKPIDKPLINTAKNVHNINDQDNNQAIAADDSKSNNNAAKYKTKHNKFKSRSTHNAGNNEENKSNENGLNNSGDNDSFDSAVPNDDHNKSVDNTDKTKSNSDNDLQEDDSSNEEDILDRIASANKKSKLFKTDESPLVHAPHFPAVKYERWTLFLIQKSKKQPILVATSKVHNFINTQTIDLAFPAPKASPAATNAVTISNNTSINTSYEYEYELHAMCDSYIGCDVMKTFNVKVHKEKKPGATAIKSSANSNNDTKTVDGKIIEGTSNSSSDEPVVEGKWYYLYFESFWELLLNAFVLGLLCVFIFNFLWSRGYWQRYIQPSVDHVAYYTSPVYNRIDPYIQPFYSPILLLSNKIIAYLAQVLHAEPPPPVRKSRYRTAADEAYAQEEQELRKAEKEAEAAARKVEQTMGQHDDDDDIDQDNENNNEEVNDKNTEKHDNEL